MSDPRPPLEFVGDAMINMADEWQELAVRLGHANVGEMLQDVTNDFVLRPRQDGWACEWVRFYNGVRSDRRQIFACRSLVEVLRRMNEVEDAGDQADADDGTASQALWLDYTKAPRGYVIEEVAPGDEALPQGGWRARCSVACLDRSTEAEALKAAWTHHKSRHDPPGMCTEPISMGTSVRWKFRCEGRYYPNEDFSIFRHLARDAAWKWYDRRRAYKQLCESAAAILGEPVEVSDDLLSWDDGRVALAEVEVAAKLHADGERKLEAVLRSG